jgi:hypothetical protein
VWEPEFLLFQGCLAPLIGRRLRQLPGCPAPWSRRAPTGLLDTVCYTTFTLLSFTPLSRVRPSHTDFQKLKLVERQHMNVLYTKCNPNRSRRTVGTSTTSEAQSVGQCTDYHQPVFARRIFIKKSCTSFHENHTV